MIIHDLLQPISEYEFSQNYWGKKALYLEGSKDKFSDLFNWQKLNEILNSNISPHPAIILAKSGAKSTPKNHRELIEALRNGSTAVVQNIDQYDSKLSDFLDQISYELVHNTRFNLYLSFPSKAGYLTHYDTHDVFIFQISGKKKWRIFSETIKNPLFVQKKHGVSIPREDCIYIDQVLTEGDLLYIPRGHWHDAIATEELSVHLTLAAFPRTGIYFMNWIMNELTEILEFRNNFPLIYPSDRESSIRAKYHEHINTLKKQLIQFLEEPNLIDNFYNYIVSNTTSRPNFGLPYINGIENADKLKTLNFRRPPRIFRLISEESSIFIVFNGKKITLPSICSSIIEFVFSQEFFNYEGLKLNSNLDDVDILKLINLLLEEEIIIVN